MTFNSLSNYLVEKNIDFSERTFYTLGLKDKNENFTNLAFLLSDQSDISIKLAEYDYNMNFKLKKEFKGSLVKLLFEIRDQVFRMNDVSAQIDSSTFERIEQLSYPEIALREMLVNAVCHADYFIHSNIKIEFFPDHLKITNPGGIFNATLEDILKGTQTYRNPKLVHIFDKLGLIENFGTGIFRTISAYKKYNKAPLFESTENFFYVTLPNLNFTVSDQINDQINDQISNFGLLILKLIKQNPGIKVPELFLILSKDDGNLYIDKIRNTIKRELKNYIELKGSKKAGGYFIKTKN